jgi:hypothetical protein
MDDLVEQRLSLEHALALLTRGRRELRHRGPSQPPAVN